MSKRILTLVLALALLLAVTIAVSAETASVTITGGSLSVTAANVTLSGVTLDGTDKTATSAAADNSWSAIDARGTGDGWHLTIAATDFTGGGHTIDIALSDQLFKIAVLNADITVTAGNTKPVSSSESLVSIGDTSALTFVTAALNTGMGSYSIKPSFSLMIPAETYAGTYTSTITITAVTAP